MSDAVTFVLNGEEVEAAPGETIWQVAAREGVEIPHLYGVDFGDHFVDQRKVDMRRADMQIGYHGDPQRLHMAWPAFAVDGRVALDQQPGLDPHAPQRGGDERRQYRQSEFEAQRSPAAAAVGPLLFAGAHASAKPAAPAAGGGAWRHSSARLSMTRRQTGGTRAAMNIAA